MTANQKKLATKLGALAVVVLMLKVVGVAPVVIICAIVGGVLLLLTFKRSQRRKTEMIFGFYVAADEILRDDEKRRYRFEIADVINAGEDVVRMMPDPPALSSFALGALYDSIADYNCAVEHLGLAAEEQLLKDSPHVSPSRPLRRYVKRLREIERRPERWPKISAAIRSLELMHHERAAQLLAKNQVQLKRLVEAYEGDTSQEKPASTMGVKISADRPLRSIQAPPPISEVLQDVYQEEPKPS